jgi:hypothetical protein
MQTTRTDGFAARAPLPTTVADHGSLYGDGDAQQRMP